MSIDSNIVMMKESVGEPKKRSTHKEIRIQGYKSAIGLVERRLNGVKKEKEKPHTESTIRNFESRLKRLKYELAELEAS